MELQVDCVKMSVELLGSTIQKVVYSSEDSSNNGVILVVGTNEATMRKVIQDGIKESGLDYVTIIPLASPNWGIVLGGEFLEPPVPETVVILLENWSPELLSEYMDSGISEFFKAKRIQLVTVCWTVQHEPVKFKELSVFRQIVVQEPEMEVPSSAPPQSHEEAIVLQTLQLNGWNSQGQEDDEEEDFSRYCCFLRGVLSLFGICNCFC